MIEYYVADGLAVLRLNAPPVNALTFALLDALVADLRRAAADPSVERIAILGEVDFFSAGADVSLFRHLATAADAMRVCRAFEAAYRAIEDSPKPVVAVLAGQTLGGALELAMACRWRLAVRNARLAMPEVKLGLCPGAGGTQRLPRLVGVKAAIDLMLTGQAISAERAFELGLVDALIPNAEIETVLEAVAKLPNREKTRDRKEKLVDVTGHRVIFAEAAKLAAAGRREVVSPVEIVEAVRVGIEESFEAGLGREQEAFCRCAATSAARNKIYVFTACRETAKTPELTGVQALPVKTVGVLGLGTMGTGIAQAFVAAGIPVVAFDLDARAGEVAVGRIRASFDRRVSQGKIRPEQAMAAVARLTLAKEESALRDADLAIEAVFENLEAKRAALARLESLCRPNAVLATNTSTINLDALAAGMKQPDRLVGMHFFNPANTMPLVEIVRREDALPAAVATALRQAKTIGKTPVLVRNREGFVVNRVFIPYLKEAFLLLEDGADPAAVDRMGVEFGFPMGPLTLVDLAGIDILQHTDAILRSTFSYHGGPAVIVDRLVEAKMLGQKTGMGVYRYEAGDHKPRPNLEAMKIIAESRRPNASPPGDDEIGRRLVFRMVAEAFRTLHEHVVTRASDLDAAMVLGTGLADFRGGIVRHAQDVGLEHVRDVLADLAVRYGERFAVTQ